MKKILILQLLFLSVLSLSAQSEKSWKVDAATGYQFLTSGGGGMFALNIGIQRQFNSWFSLGFTTGSYFPKSGKPTIPFLVDARGTYPIANTELALLGIVRAGYYMDTNNLGADSFTTFGYELLPGVQMQVNDQLSVRINTGFQSIHNTSEGTDFQMIPILIGASFTL